MDRIPHTYLEGCEPDPDTRETGADFWAWLEQQPDHAWLFYARGANWDSADTIFAKMVARPRCDLALASWLFWQSEPSYWLKQAEAPKSGTLLRAILDRCNSGGFPSGAVHYDRVEVAFNALQAGKALSELTAPPPFEIPRSLIQSFDGNNPTLGPYSPEIEQDLAEIFDDDPGKHSVIWGSFYRSDRDYFDAMRRGGNWWFEPALRLPKNPRVTDNMTAIHAIDAVFGEHRASVRRIEAQRLRSNPQPMRWGMNPDPKQRIAGIVVLTVTSLLLVLYLVGWFLRR